MTSNARFNLTCVCRTVYGFLADSVDTSLDILLYMYSCATDAVFSEVHDQ